MKISIFKPAVVVAALFLSMCLMIGCQQVDKFSSDDGRITVYSVKDYDWAVNSKSVFVTENKLPSQQAVIQRQQPAPSVPVWQPGPGTVPAMACGQPQQPLPVAQQQYYCPPQPQPVVQQQYYQQPQVVAQPVVEQTQQLNVIGTNNYSGNGLIMVTVPALLGAGGQAAAGCLGKPEVNINSGNASAGASSASSSSSGAGATVINR